MILAKEKYDYYDLEQLSRPEKKVKKIRRVKFRGNPRAKTVAMVLAVFLLGIALAGRYAQIAQTGYKINNMEKQLTALQNENDGLELEVQRLSSLDRVEKVAVEKLGMQRPNEGEGIQLLTVEPSDSPKSTTVNKQVAQSNQTTKSSDKKKTGLIEAFTNLISNLKGDNARADAKPLN